MKTTESFDMGNGIISSVTRVRGALFEPRNIQEGGGAKLLDLKPISHKGRELHVYAKLRFGENAMNYYARGFSMTRSELAVLSIGQDLAISEYFFLPTETVKVERDSDEVKEILGLNNIDWVEFYDSALKRMRGQGIDPSLNELRHRCTGYDLGLLSQSAANKLFENRPSAFCASDMISLASLS